MDFILQLSSGNSSSVAYKWLLPHPKTFTYFRSTECTVHAMSPLCLTRPCGTVGLSIFINGKWSAQRSMVMERSQSMLLHTLIKCWNQCPETNIMGFNMLCDFANLSHKTCLICEGIDVPHTRFLPVNDPYQLVVLALIVYCWDTSFFMYNVHIHDLSSCTKPPAHYLSLWAPLFTESTRVISHFSHSALCAWQFV
jgi:hypothetical protein